ncbi:MAG: hypothetical protein AUH10_14020 [Gammaproteobacteria bacterium 13_2_20CM_66_19]|nr:MAG: hypothetical protein AUH10_14020 [Gammaproteobacteria bacterium 13_2_20CM_66_19]
MKKRELDHVLRAAGRITGEKQFIIIGSQALHGKYPDLADDIVKSAEVDLLAAKSPKRTEWLNAIGVYSQFHETFGYYADPVDEKTATLPKGWKGRLVHLPPGNTEGVKGLCLEPHDLAIAKYVAFRDKDLVFTRELARRGIVSEERLLTLLDQTQIEEHLRSRIRNQITRDFHAERGIEEPAAEKQPPTASAVEDLEAIKARGRAEWLKLRRQVGVTFPTSNPTWARDSSKRSELEPDSGKGLDDDTSE